MDYLANHENSALSGPIRGVVTATGEEPALVAGDNVRVINRSPVGHYRVPAYVRGKAGVIEAVIRPAGLNNEEEAFGRNAGGKRHYYRVAIAMTELWPGYPPESPDRLFIEVFETWLEAFAS